MKNIKMRYSTEPRDGWRNMGESLSNKYGQKLLVSSKKSTTDVIKTTSKRAIQKTGETTGDLIGNKLADKITSVSKKKSAKASQNDEKEATLKKRYISPEERKQIIEELRLVPKNDRLLIN